MKSVLLLLTLLTLSSASFLDTVTSAAYINDSLLDPELGERIPEISANDSMLTDEAFLFPPPELENRQSQPQPFRIGNLEWQTWRGFLPNGAVSIYNSYTRRYDYVCKYKCEAGFYNPKMGPYCNYPFSRRAHRSAPFEILVNRDNIEFLEWKASSFGKLPQNSVGTCSRGGIYVGKNKFGLGKVHPKSKAFFLPWKRKAYWYKRRYQVLTVSSGIVSEHISDVRYKTDRAKVFQYAPETMRLSAISNRACRNVVKTVMLSEKSQTEHSWETSFTFTVGVTSSIKTRIPFRRDGEFGFSAETTFQTSKGKSVTKENTHSVSVEFDVPPNHYCRTRMVGYKYKADIPYTAQLTRKYRNGQTRWTTITGTYHSVQMGEVWAEVDRCPPVPNASPCH